MKLAMDVAEEKLRPEFPEDWNPAISYLISSCWGDSATYRPSPSSIMCSLFQIMHGEGQGLITQGRSPQRSSRKSRPKSKILNLAPGDMWQRLEVSAAEVLFGKVLGEGTFATVHIASFRDQQVAVKLLRTVSKNAKAVEENASREIEMMFSMRHPHVIGVYAWFREKVTVTRFGMIIELAGGGDLDGLYKGKDYDFAHGLKIVTGAAKVRTSLEECTRVHYSCLLQIDALLC